MKGKRRRWVWPLLGAVALILSSIACFGFGANEFGYAPFGLGEVPSYWVCATATPEPTPTRWTCDCICVTQGGDPCDHAPPPGICINPGEYWVKEPGCPPWPPPPQPTPTPFVMVGGSYWLHQRIWIPIQPTVIPDAAPGDTPAPPTAGKVGIILKSWSDHPGHRFDFEVKNISSSPIDFDLPAQVFVRCGNNNVLRVERDKYEEHGLDYPDSHFDPGEERDISLSIWYDQSCPDPILGIMTSPYVSAAGSAGLSSNAVTGGDTAIYIDYHAKVPGECSATQQAPLGAPYPEIEMPPPEPDRDTYGYASIMNGVAAGHRSDKVPVTIPPCLRITRGFGCDEFPTGVAGGDRCPADKPYWHTGVDFSCATGIPVYTPMGGALVHSSSSSGYGNLAKIILSEGGQTLQMYFAHLSAFAQSDLCHRGGICHPGSQVGAIGSTGFSTGPHLHWEFRVNNVPVDPFQYFGGSAGSGLPRMGPQGPVAGLQGTEQSMGILAAPAAVAASPVPTATRRPPNEYPLKIRVRDADGNGFAGIEVALSDIDGEEVVGSCTSDDSGECRLDLPSGVYQIRLAGEVGGHPVDPVGELNLEAMASGRAEYYYGPLALWHDPPHSTAGFILEEDESGVLQPVIDADPTSEVPQPVDPVEDLPAATPTPSGVGPGTTQPTTAREGDGGPLGRRLLRFALFAAAFGLLILVYFTAQLIREQGEGMGQGE